MLFQLAGPSRESGSMTAQWLGGYGKVEQKAGSRLTALSPCPALSPAPMPGNSAVGWCHPFFCPQRGLATLPSALQAGNGCSPCDPGSSDRAVDSQVSALLPHRSTAKPATTPGVMGF